ncbi:MULTISPECIES: flagellar basal-body rod protein FlgG [Limnobacter]|uniref:flagellar basal-body rod protein FlgG n=2 Tax=Burkholderiaceae TaxID=119060 RepID=UPI000C3D8BCB|nr:MULTISPECIES: flagellar basal-body rod protein FlgG [unclassified Limnobacter]MAG82146.1 flagellar basal body rod protein FlgG [Sutterellaceae bacterium]HAV74384.1 flagellar basal body rod protein FlgG [Limnobacter sp.]|tara:strand:+ start:4362 stop:5144 length:783 start_codon:yes stop_codon:yes gene_type:complete
MMRSLWIAKTGLDAQQTQLDVISNNLANTATNGFKRSRAVFEDLLYQTLRQPGAQTTEQTQVPSGLQIGTGVKPVSTVRNFAQGNLQQTGNTLDVAINGQGFFQVQMPDGTTSYTRDGSIQIDANGTLVTSNGYPILGPVTIPQGVQEISISQDGVVSAVVQGQVQPQELGQIQLASFVNPAGLFSMGQNLYSETAASGTPTQAVAGTNGVGFVSQGFVETSNVNVVEELVGLIQAQRAYEINSKAISTSDQMLQRLSQL